MHPDVFVIFVKDMPTMIGHYEIALGVENYAAAAEAESAPYSK